MTRNPGRRRTEAQARARAIRKAEARRARRQAVAKQHDAQIARAAILNVEDRLLTAPLRKRLASAWTIIRGRRARPEESPS